MVRSPESWRHAIRRASADVLDELAAMLTLLRDVGESVERAPTPGIGEIPVLVASAQDAEVRVLLNVEGSTDQVPVPVGTAAYRIVQESLTNVIRHAGARWAEMTVRAAGNRGLRSAVVDDGIGPPGEPSPRGHGIQGMRERVEATGGRLFTGPAEAGGFAVAAVWDGPP